MRRDAAAGWRELEDRDLLRPRTLPSGMAVVSLRIENAPATGPLRLEFSAGGAASAFRLVLGLGEARAHITGSPVGVIAVDTTGGRDAPVPTP